MDLSALADFNLVAAHGGFGKASRFSGRPKATLSRRVMDLEQSLGVRLLERGARSLRLTEEGQVLHERTHGLLGDILEAGELVSAGQTSPRGYLRVSAPVLFSHTLVGRLAAGFALRYPQVRLDITAEDRNVDLVEDGYDVVIRVNPKADALLVGRCFARDDMLLVAPAALPRPSASCDGEIAEVPAVALANRFDKGPWHYQDGDTLGTVMPDVRLRLSSLIMIRDAVLAGAGAALIPRSLLQRDEQLAKLSIWGRMPDRPIELWALHASRRLVSRKVTAFIDYLCEAFPDQILGHGFSAD
ncbi:MULTISPECIES: LysR substrate-binding domain-containing protein [unclassified Pseudomonas]|uniref:LysR substrate-binding domain-containing protein n=1 Tax=unclassified Pseudomonas TaxID=196821 RepID=UPI0006D3B3D5|nr:MULTISPECIES: LysR substrate-binding domain-containing protein [unclassified Pseudomonas]